MMKQADIQEARDYFTGLCDRLGNCDADNQVCATAIWALEKQIPKPAKPHKRIPGIAKCPSCKTDLCMEPGDSLWCPDCGQAVYLEEVKADD